jgi:glycosyltransferase involved in cell wall biosynthesis
MALNSQDKEPKVVLVFDDLIQNGGAERLLLAVCELFPDAPVYTSLASDRWINRLSDREISLKTSFMQKLPFKSRLNRLYSVLGFHILAFESFDFSDYDLVISISARYAHGVVTKPTTKHVCYINSPGRMFWETRSYFSHEPWWVRGLSLLTSPFLNHVRIWDYTSAQRVDHFIANSEVPAARVKKYYGREASVIHPFFDFSPDLEKTSPSSTLTSSPEQYFLVLTRLAPWKRVDIAVNACIQGGHSLKIAGEGPALRTLRKKASGHNNIEFLGYVSEKEKINLLRNCTGLIVTQKEDFGIAPLEAMAVGKPVIAYGEGGSLVTVVPGITGELFDHQDPGCLAETLEEFEGSKYTSEDCMRQSRLFTKDKFLSRLEEAVNNVYFNLL